MPTLLEQAPQIQKKPHPCSHDCGHEHSLEHWLEVYWLVEEETTFASSANREPALITGTVLIDIPRPGPVAPPRPAKSAAHHHRSALRP